MQKIISTEGPPFWTIGTRKLLILNRPQLHTPFRAFDRYLEENLFCPLHPIFTTPIVSRMMSTSILSRRTPMSTFRILPPCTPWTRKMMTASVSSSTTSELHIIKPHLSGGGGGPIRNLSSSNLIDKDIRSQYLHLPSVASRDQIPSPHPLRICFSPSPFYRRIPM